MADSGVSRPEFICEDMCKSKQRGHFKPFISVSASLQLESVGQAKRTVTGSDLVLCITGFPEMHDAAARWIVQAMAGRSRTGCSYAPGGRSEWPYPLCERRHGNGCETTGSAPATPCNLPYLTEMHNTTSDPNAVFLSSASGIHGACAVATGRAGTTVGGGLERTWARYSDDGCGGETSVVTRFIWLIYLPF